MQRHIVAANGEVVWLKFPSVEPVALRHLTGVASRLLFMSFSKPTKQFRVRHNAENYEQLELLRPSLEEAVPEGSACRWLLAAVMELELSEFMEPSYGGASYDPRRMLAVWFLAIYDGLSSSRQIERFCRTDWQYRFLTGGHVPDHATLCRFRRKLGDVLPRLLAATVAMARSQGIASFSTVALDGTRLPGAVDQWTKALSRIQIEEEPDEPDSDGKPRRKTPSDPDARTIKSRKGFLTGYNAQAAVDTASGFVAMGYVTNESNDQIQMERSLQELKKNAVHPKELLADSGYATPRSAALLAEQGIAPILSPNLRTNWTLTPSGPACSCGTDLAVMKSRFHRKGVPSFRLKCRACLSSFTYPQDVDPEAWLKLCQQDKTGALREKLKERAGSIERLFAQVKTRYRLRAFTLRTLPLVTIQWLLVLTLHNLTLLR